METICYAEDGVIGLEMVKKGMECFNVLIVDNLMPNMTGVDMTRQLRLLGYPYLIIGLTGNVMEQDMNEFTEAGADYVLMKPVNMADVRGLITFMNDHGSISRTNSATKLMLTNHHFRWVAITPVMT
jgi:CheY-like chemotaxis protein